MRFEVEFKFKDGSAIRFELPDRDAQNVVVEHARQLAQSAVATPLDGLLLDDVERLRVLAGWRGWREVSLEVKEHDKLCPFGDDYDGHGSGSDSQLWDFCTCEYLMMVRANG